MTYPLRPGRPRPLGATFDGEGVNFALFSENASGVVLCLFEEAGKETRVPLRERTAYVWHGYVTGLRPGQRYGFRVDGRFEPAAGRWFNPHKLLVDPYARAIEGKADHSGPIRAGIGDPAKMQIDERDDAAFVPRSVVVEGTFDWEGDARPDVPWPDTVLYELHVKGFTKRHPGVPSELRGTYLGLACPAAIDHLTRLGVTAVELLPVHEHADEPGVARRGMTNYWGYSTLGFFAPAARFAMGRGTQVREFKQMVKALHRAGIEVVLDVVYNHTCEGDHLGPSLSLRGIDNRTYYRLRRDNPLLYEDFSGCGNSLNMVHSEPLKLIMDSLRYWVVEMHVDGFRFDLASTLAREAGSVDKLSAFFDIVHQDPILSGVKLIAEPWDLGEGGYQVGNFPVLWTEWNGRFRDTVRRFWRGDKSQIGEMGFRLTGSSDLYEDDGRHPHASINFVTAHDGFTLRDLVSYEKKHNEANGENNKDGWDDNQSWNCGVEGETGNPAISGLRARQVRNFFATLLLSQGVPMLSSGDEIGKTQHGNNNPYCRDDEISWLDWHAADKRLLAWVQDLLRLRKSEPVFRRRRFLRGERMSGSKSKDIGWFRQDGEEMTLLDWQKPERATIALLLAGDALGWTDDLGNAVVGDTFLFILSASPEEVVFTVPHAGWGERWEVVFDTQSDQFSGDRAPVDPGDKVALAPFSVVLLRRTAPVRGSWRPFRVG
jgi:glycogen operon protein